MQLQETLEAMGYRVGTRSVGMEALCSIELNGRVRTFVSNSEKSALDAAVTHVELLEQRFSEQQRRLQCEGCGD